MLMVCPIPLLLLKDHTLKVQESHIYGIWFNLYQMVSLIDSFHLDLQVVKSRTLVLVVFIYLDS